MTPSHQNYSMHVLRAYSDHFMGVSINGARFNHLRFADDIIIISESFKEIETMLRELAEASEKSGL